jgi:hypothetical protein
MRISEESIYNIIRRYTDRSLQEYFDKLNEECRRIYNSSCIYLLLENPSTLRSFIVDRFGSNTYAIAYVVRFLFLKPLLIALGESLDLEEKLTGLFIHDIKGFEERLRHILAKHQQITS